MPRLPGISVFIEPAEVYATYEETRLIDVKWLSMEGSRRGVVVVNNPGNTSMPQPGDRGLVLGAGNHFYFVGKIEYNYQSKVEGNYINPSTGKKETSKQVEGGEVYLTNTKTKSWVSLSNSGDMSLFNGFMEGFKYFSNLRMPEVIGKTAGLLGNGIKFMVGTAVRNIPSVGEQPIAGTSGGKALEALLQIAYMGVQTVRFHLGEIMDLTTGLVPELSTWGARVKALLEVTAGPAPLGSITIDELGNTEIKSTTGDVNVTATLGNVTMQGTQTVTVGVPATPVKLGSISILPNGTININSVSGQVVLSGMPVGGILLGSGALHPVAWGEVIYAYLNLFATHYHTSFGSTGTPTVDVPSPNTPMPPPPPMFGIQTLTS